VRRARRRSRLLLALAAALGAAACASLRTPDLDATALEIAQLLQSGDIEAAAARLHFPVDYTEAQIAKDRSGVVRGLRAVADELGEAGPLERVDRVGTFVDLGMGGGDFSYWRRYSTASPTRKFYFSTTFSRYGPGFIVVAFVVTPDAVLPQSLGYSFDPQVPGARKKVAALAQRMADTIAADIDGDAQGVIAEFGDRTRQIIDDLPSVPANHQPLAQPLPMEKVEQCRADWIQLLANGIPATTASYWPEGTLGGLEPWYSIELCSLGEPPLVPLEDDDSTVLRLLWLPAFHPAVAVRVEWRDGHGSISAGEYRHAYEEVSLDSFRRIGPKSVSADEWSSLERELAAIVFSDLPAADPDKRGFDGSEWLIELVRGEHYHAVARWNGIELQPLGRRMIELSGLAPERIY